MITTSVSAARAGSRRPNEAPRIAADDGSGGQHPGVAPVDRAAGDEHHAGDDVDQAAAQTFFRPLRWWMSSTPYSPNVASIMMPIAAPK